MNSDENTPRRPLGAYRFIRGSSNSNGYAALGKAVELQSQHPAFGNRPFGEWSKILMGQINRGHFAFIACEDKITGFIGWLRTDRASGEAWLRENKHVKDPNVPMGEAVVVNAIQAEDRGALRLIRAKATELEKPPFTIYAKRFYKDGTIRPLTYDVSVEPDERRIRP